MVFVCEECIYIIECEFGCVFFYELTRLGYCEPEKDISFSVLSFSCLEKFLRDFCFFRVFELQYFFSNLHFTPYTALIPPELSRFVEVSLLFSLASDG